MRTTTRWAFWRRLWYGTGFGAVLSVLLLVVYFNYFYAPSNCFDNNQNGEELGVDCGGGCVRICAFAVTPPEVRWSRSFKVTEGQYNAVAYIENNNQVAATPAISYTLSLYDEDGLIAARTGTTILPPDSVYPVFEGRIQTGERIPTQTFIEIANGELWLPASSGRDQFTVVNRTLVNTDTRPRLDATIRNNSLVSAEEVEVVATIFDARGNALTASRTFVDEFLPRSERNITFTWPEPIAKTIRSCEVPTDVLLAIDLSGSMNNDQEEPPEPISSVISAAEAFVNRLQAEDQAAVITFATQAAIKLNFSNDLARAAEVINLLQIDPEEEAGNTNTGDAFVRATEEFSSVRHNPNARKVMVILTDGLATAPDENAEQYALEQAATLKSKDVEIYAIGLGQMVNMDFVSNLASNPSLAYQAISRSEVDAIYQEITSALCEDGAAVIDIVPKSDAGFQSLR